MKKEATLRKWLCYVRLLKGAQLLVPALLFLLIDIPWNIFSTDRVFSRGFITTHLAIAAAIILFSYIILTLINNLQLRITQQIHNQIITQDRERIAREMHDGTAQVLGYISTQAIAAKKMLGDGRLAEARDELAKMTEIVRDLYSDVREGILGLRTSAVREGDLITNLREYASHYTEMCGIQVEIKAPSDVLSGLTPPSEIQVMRIIQEALTNIRKHAKAKTTEITFGRNDNKLNITIADDGQGFELTRIQPTGWPRFGLQAMQERAQAIGGDFNIVTAPGKGCQVSVCLPYHDYGKRA